MADKSKLDWVQDGLTDGEVAYVERNGTKYRIRAVRDDHPSNPFEGWDSNWPICVRSSDGFTHYSGDTKLDHPLAFANGPTIVHMQHNIARLFGTVGNTVYDLMECYGLDEPVKHCRDADILRDVLQCAIDDVSDSDKLERLVKVYDVLGIPAYCGQRNGYSQGDWVEVLAVATPEVQAAFGTPADRIAADLSATADLYGWWAFGDVYGYVVEQEAGSDPHSPDDPDREDMDWEELPDGSCWGYYGSDHSASGLEDAALECLPADERVPA